MWSEIISNGQYPTEVLFPRALLLKPPQSWSEASLCHEMSVWKTTTDVGMIFVHTPPPSVGHNRR